MPPACEARPKSRNEARRATTSARQHLKERDFFYSDAPKLSPQNCRRIAAGFLINGVLFGTWAGHIARVKDHFCLSDQDLSKLLLLLGLGALLSFTFAGRLCDSMGAPRITRAAACALLVATVFLGFAQTVQQLGLSLFLFGMCHGVLDVAINNWGSEVEKHMRRSVNVLVSRDVQPWGGPGRSKWLCCCCLSRPNEY
ncbi:MFS transporter [Sinorhizobium meliloti]|uniref:MFS transporter n=1 Tax=Rhizobium meliloti TaxID=382 RepID=UPI002E0F69D1|nr:MFS transporter [Sinorhizobium meliloti]